MVGKIVEPAQWLEARKTLLQKEKDLVRASDALAKERQELPMVRVTKNYTFEGPSGARVSLSDLFDGRDQLLVYHYMFAPEDTNGCGGCRFAGEHIPTDFYLRQRQTSLAVVSRAPFDKLNAFKEKMGWSFPWYSSGGSDFNYDFHVTLDADKAPAMYNYMTAEELEAKGKKFHLVGDQPGWSVFLKRDGEIFHTYSTFARGGDKFLGTLQLLDMTPLGRQDGSAGPEGFKMRGDAEE
ncbi:hypothetical protein F5X68DRAFT_237727 [Plectosphaerella plurivora]|uniref:Dithiol-disulfide oxidoreductase (DUF899 family) n=1 Tax=Plectosphaerella plurivora TaxID=936078 RepID=A0A9P9A4N9_9PEZI|nr:hypothetical protein F5X68DRAFT_237727 [Plectosphaerella plurivora]